ncbi:hypothetical protein H257_05280 [Aphanomyces astaci]|uniref:Tc1-like transposase DDE domain-containing protein n=1 Tax=Aphanomyces astaci TaxID=112090 RepID=W4GRZ2_APHAT|nr:hypothetical protein H257_05280 [Aphanomyces astaci]ETV81653.1 hypothetical protein H257_05280 [Aphanomyces astaci]|eukprot:XP_009828390.1 hypothetical protein H257_05280 [Aphanomyces astaci]
MASPPARKSPTPEEKKRVLDAYINGGRDWKIIAAHLEVNCLTHRPLESHHLTTARRTTRQVHESNACDLCREKRQEFARAVLQHQESADYMVYYDETNYILYCKRSLGRSKKGERAVVTLPPSKGPNLQIHCAVSARDGLVCSRLEHGSIPMEQNAAFIVIFLDNAPAHSQTETRVVAHDDMVLLRLSNAQPYRVMLQCLKGCDQALPGPDMFDRRDYDTYLEARMCLLEDAARESLVMCSAKIQIKVKCQGAKCARVDVLNSASCPFSNLSSCPRMAKHKGPTPDEKKHVLDAHLRGKDWKTVGKHNGVTMATARRVVITGRTTLLQSGWFRTSKSKVTPEIRAALETYINANCQYTLREMQSFLAVDFPGTSISVQTISRHLLGMLYFVKQVRIEPVTCNNDVNKAKRQNFALKPRMHQ